LRDFSRGERDLFDRRLLGDERANLDALLHLLERRANVEHDETEQPHREKGKGDRRYAQYAEEWSAPSSEKSVANCGHVGTGLFREAFQGGLGRLRRIEHDLTAIELDRAVVGTTNEVEV